MRHYLLYGHGGSYNHGGEAMAQATVALLRRISPDCRITLCTHFAEQDREFHVNVDEFVERAAGSRPEEIYAAAVEQIMPETICICLGGDNYCYPNWQRYAYIHEQALARGAVSVLWSCSVEPEGIDEEMLAVLRGHHLITAREGETYRALTERGLQNVVKVSDIAFTLPAMPVPYSMERYAVLNLSPLILKKAPLLREAFRRLLDYILKETDLQPVLLPHVMAPADNDWELLKKFRDETGDRVWLTPGNFSAAEYKFLIAGARLGVFARTHAAIAAYSSRVPALALGYSAKARGIAADLGMSEYLLEASRITNRNILVEDFQKLQAEEEMIREKLEALIPAYEKEAVSARALQVLKGVEEWDG